MKFGLSIFLGSIIWAQSMLTIPFDYGGQFGYLNQDGVMFWNEDWRSNGLLFDGTWSIYPRRYGPKIESEFHSNYEPIEVDSNKTESFFAYDLGDYNLDRFSLGATYTGQGRGIKLYGFKRTYNGHYNQYDNNSNQPNQQSYLGSYISKNKSNQTQISFGHFNTYSGIADSTSRGLIDHNITNMNVSIIQQIGSVQTQFSIDQVLERMVANHSLSAFSGVRYLTRSQFAFNIQKGAFQIDISENNRAVRMGELIHQSWFRIGSQFNNYGLGAHVGWVINGDSNSLDYNLQYSASLKSLKFNLSTQKIVKPYHPYYSIITLDKSSRLTDISKNKIELSWVSDKHEFNIAYSQIYDADFFSITDNTKIPSAKNQGEIGQLIVGLKSSQIPFVDVGIEFVNQSTGVLYDGGIAYFFNYFIQSDFNLFDNFMKIQMGADVRRNIKRRYTSTIHPIEMIPMEFTSASELDDIALLNGFVRAKVSTFTIQYDWYNITEMVLAQIGSELSNFYNIHPEMPSIGRQANLSVEWQFLN